MQTWTHYIVEFNSIPLKYLNSSPCTGFVSKSATISSVGLYCTVTSPLLILSVMKKYLILMCLVLFDVDRPFSINDNVLLLSYHSRAGPMFSPCAMRKFRTQMTCDSPSDTPTNSASVELFDTSFCFVDET